MRALPAALETIHVAALGVWVGAVGMTAVVAAVIFPEMSRLDPSLPEFSAYPEEHGVIAAGWVMARVFMALDWVQLVCAGLATLAFFLRLVIRRRAPIVFAAVRLVLIVASAAVMLWYLLSVAQPMNADIVGFWRAAQAGDVERANELRSAFDARHPTASRSLGAIVVLALLTLLVSGLSATLPKRERP
jgi:hypothetical protein